jgi:hypothetical protein
LVIPWAGDGKGKAGEAEFFLVMGETTEVLKFEPHQYVASGDRVVAEGSPGEHMVGGAVIGRRRISDRS